MVKGQGRAERRSVKKLYRSKAVMATIYTDKNNNSDTKTRVSENLTCITTSNGYSYFNPPIFLLHS